LIEGKTNKRILTMIRNLWLTIPNFKATNKVTEKSDVYKFGQLLLDLLTGEDSRNITTIEKISLLNLSLS
jgi:hypothetical protein